MTVEFVRSCFSGYWRFFASRPDIITPGAYFFVPDNNPHLRDFHYFGSQDWQKGDEPDVVGAPPPVKLGNDKSLGWKWANGKAPNILPPPGRIGELSAFGQSQTFDPNADMHLFNGIDFRCYPKDRPCFVNDLREFALDNCEYALILIKLLELVGDLNQAPITEFLTTLLGPGTQIDYDDGSAEHPPYAVIQSPRNNLLLLYGTHNNRLLRTQLEAGFAGPQNFGDISTNPVWWQHSTRIIDFLNALSFDYNKPTDIAGHSLGGATASVLWWRLFNADRSRVLRLITFGCPKPGDIRLLDQLDQNADQIHFHDAGDIVPLVPPPNSMRAFIQIPFPFIPDAWFTEWVPHAEYVHLLPGGEWAFGPAAAADVVTYLGFMLALFVTGEEDPINAHYAPAYIRRLLLHCPMPEAPIDADCFRVLFGFEAASNGGPLLAGFGALDGDQVAGLVLGGLGVLDGDLAAALELAGSGLIDGDMAAALELGGGGLADGDMAAALEFGGSDGTGDTAAALEFGGSGEIAIVPGSSCSTSGIMTIGDTYNGTHGGFGTEQWFKCAVTNGNEVHVTISGSNTLTNADVGHGTSCPPTNIGTINTTITPCIAYTPGADENVYIRVPGVFSGSTSYTISVLSGPC